MPEGFAPFEDQGPFLDHIGPVYAREDAGSLVLGLRAEERHNNHRADCSLTVEEREIVRARAVWVVVA